MPTFQILNSLLLVLDVLNLKNKKVCAIHAACLAGHAQNIEILQDCLPRPVQLQQLDQPQNINKCSVRHKKQFVLALLIAVLNGHEDVVQGTYTITNSTRPMATFSIKQLTPMTRNF